MGNAASDRDSVGGLLDLFELGNRGDVDQQVGLYQAQIQHRAERLPAGQKLHRDVLACTERAGGGEVAGAFVIEAYRFHVVLRPACAMAVRIRRGVMGECSSSTPNRRRASFTALTMAAGGAIAPPSPMPLTPNSVYGASAVSYTHLRAHETPEHLV